jgi:hypothetical protein
MNRNSIRIVGLAVVETAHHKETPYDAAAEVLRVNAARPDLAGWVMIGGWPLLRSSQTPSFDADLQKRALKVVVLRLDHECPKQPLADHELRAQEQADLISFEHFRRRVPGSPVYPRVCRIALASG